MKELIMYETELSALKALYERGTFRSPFYEKLIKMNIVLMITTASEEYPLCVKSI